jgi:hypothetical protein
MNDDEDQIRNENDAREAYEPPKMECDELFEQLALACGKINPVTHGCTGRGGNRLS